MNVLKKICTIIDTVIDVVCQILSFLVLAVVAVIMCEVILRRVLGKPQIWTTDLITMLFGAYTIMVLALGFQHGTFVKVDLIVERLKPIVAHWLQLITALIFQLPFCWYLIPRSYQFVAKSIATNEKGYSVWAPALWPVKMCLFIGLIFVGIQFISEFLKELDWIISYYKNGKVDQPAIGSLSTFDPLKLKKNEIKEGA